VVTLVGYGAHGQDIDAIAQRCGRDLRVIDERDQNGYAVGEVLLGVNSPHTRRAMAERYPRAAEPLMDPSVVRGIGVSLGRGCVIAPNVVLLRHVSLGQHVHVNYGSTMTRCSIGDFTTIAPGVTICGDVEIGEAVFVGAGATICNLLKIGDGAVIAAGAVVIHDVPAGETVRGVPACARSHDEALAGG
jgi:acetyltransferase-like isoleucine patch superfamily enzyme